MLAKIYSLLVEMKYDKMTKWETHLPVRYQDAALYSVVVDLSADEDAAIISSLKSWAALTNG